MRFQVAKFAKAVSGAVALVWACSLHAANPSVADTGYEIINMIATPSLYWVDNDRLLFVGINKPQMEAAITAREVDRATRLRKLYLWNGSTRTVRHYADAQTACFSKGFISYSVRVDKTAGKQIVREGRFGSEKEIEKNLPSEEAVHSNFTCQPHLRSELLPPAPRFRHVVVLREGDGYLDLGPGGGPNYFEERRATTKNLILYQATGKAIQLPMTWEENFSPSEVVFSAYRGAYILRPRAPRGAPLGVVGPWPKDRPLVVYLLWADGRVERISIPYFPTAGLADPRPVKSGWVFGGGYFKASGLYLFDGAVISKIDVGAVKEIALSPNGCKGAVAIQNKHLDMGTPTNLKVFDFCAGGK